MAKDVKALLKKTRRKCPHCGGALDDSNIGASQGAISG